MKKTLLLLSLVLGVALPTVVRADEPNSTSTRSVTVTRTAPARTTHTSSSKVVYYIAQEARTGSHIPTVYRAYDGRIDSASSPAVYGQSAIRQTGALDVGTALYKLDPSISVRTRG